MGRNKNTLNSLLSLAMNISCLNKVHFQISTEYTSHPWCVSRLHCIQNVSSAPGSVHGTTARAVASFAWSTSHPSELLPWPPPNLTGIKDKRKQVWRPSRMQCRSWESSASALGGQRSVIVLLGLGLLTAPPAMGDSEAWSTLMRQHSTTPL